MTVEISFVKPENVLDYVDAVRTMCNAIERKTGDPSQFVQIMRALINAQATLWVVVRDGETVGHLVSSYHEDRFSGSRLAHLWAMHGKDLGSWIADALNQAKAIAKQAGASHITLASVRPGWAKFMQAHMPEMEARLVFSLKV